MIAANRLYVARHGETVFNAGGRLQGDALHTPLTRAGFAQADAMGRALRDRLGSRPALTLWSSTAGRALQTLAVIAEHLDLDWHDAQVDDRLCEIDVGGWSGRTYAELVAEGGPVLDRETGLFVRRADDGEWYDGIAARLGGWLADHGRTEGDTLIIMHGVSSRVLRGMLTGIAARDEHRAPVARGLPQGSIAMIENGVERIVHTGDGQAPA